MYADKVQCCSMAGENYYQMSRLTETKEPIHVQITSLLRGQILGGEIKAGEGISSESELCKKFGISRGPVRRAMDSLVKERLICRMPGRGTFVTQGVLRHSNSRTKPYKILVIIDANSEMQNDRFFLDIIKGLNAIASETHPICNLMYEFCELGTDNGFAFFDRDVDGIFFIPFSTTAIDFLSNITPSQKKIPVVCFFRKVESSTVSNFYIDHEDGAFKATNYLLGLGHKKIAILLVAPIHTRCDSHQRLVGYERAFRKVGIEPDASMILETGLTVSSVKQALLSAFENGERPTALMIGGYALERPVFYALMEMGINAPADISLIVFDDSPEAILHVPPLTVVRQPFERGTRMALERLVAEIRSNDLDPIRIAINPELVIRDTTESI